MKNTPLSISMASRFLILALALVLAIVTSLAPNSLGQIINNPCTPSMITAFTSCMNFPTNSSINGTATPSTDCCNSMKSVMTSGNDCLCLVSTTSIPFQIPINRTFVASLPRACNMTGVPLRCKATGAPAPALAPHNAPSVSTPPPPTNIAVPPPPPEPSSPTSGQGVDGPPRPPAPPASGGAPSNTGSRAGGTTSASQPACTISQFLSLGAVLGVVALKYVLLGHQIM